MPHVDIDRDGRLHITLDRADASSAEPATRPLSPRERDVLGLVVLGFTDAEVGRRLGISTRTVNKHLEHVYAKTGAANRTQAAMLWAHVA
jgi:DNA-binding CsgD family transcriptional regulator